MEKEKNKNMITKILMMIKSVAIFIYNKKDVNFYYLLVMIL